MLSVCLNVHTEIMSGGVIALYFRHRSLSLNADRRVFLVATPPGNLASWVTVREVSYGRDATFDAGLLTVSCLDTAVALAAETERWLPGV